MRIGGKRAAGQLEVKVWREPGFKDGDPLAWRAQVWEGRKTPFSVTEPGATAHEALDACRARWRDEREAAESVTWAPLVP